MARILAATDATTIHRLLGWLPGPRFTHDRQNPLPCQLVVIDETSMVSLPLMARLLDGLRPEARLVLVGDPYQLASIEAGTVLGDLVGTGRGAGCGRRPPEASPLAGRVTVLRRMHRFGPTRPSPPWPRPIRRGDADAVMDILGAGRSATSDGCSTPTACGVDQVRGQLVEAGVDVVDERADAAMWRPRWPRPGGSSSWPPPGTGRSDSTTGMTGSKRTSATGCRR